MIVGRTILVIFLSLPMNDQYAWGPFFTTALIGTLLTSMGEHARLVGVRSEVVAKGKACRLFGLAVAFFLTSFHVVDFFYGVIHSGSTDPFSGVAILLIPFIVILSVSIYYYFGWGLWMFWRFRKNPYILSRKYVKRVSVWYICLVLSGGYKLCDQLRQTLVIYKTPSMTRDELHKLVMKTWTQKRPWVLNAMLCNAHLSGDDLRIIGDLRDPILHQYRHPVFVPSACNSQDFPTMLLVVRHENVTIDVLKKLGKSPNQSISLYAEREELDRVIARVSHKH